MVYGVVLVFMVQNQVQIIKFVECLLVFEYKQDVRKGKGMIFLLCAWLGE